MSFVMTRSIFSRSLGCSEEPRVKLVILKVIIILMDSGITVEEEPFVLVVVMFQLLSCSWRQYLSHASYRLVQESFFGLTGARLDGAEMLACGLATQYVFSTLTCDAKLTNIPLTMHPTYHRMSLLDREGTDGAGDWISATIQALKNASPASLKISCLSREYRMWQPWGLEEMKDSMVERGRSKASTKGKLACFSNGGKAVKWRR
ncbi:hypothetical protein HID58_085073 [Brassica napus]|uniref:3-hydroxyisobutyryl-CoA hydrolase n=1 Tax=Brassica napus TaxID=3708 RepID=A0ABQ7XNI9_BRANA|nr:hypothetical protein HID58_085073 [Brassica napus]